MNHPYAGAYTNMAQSFSGLTSGGFNGSASTSIPDNKRSRVSPGEKDMSDDDDDDDDDGSDDDASAKAALAAAAAKPNRKIVKGPDGKPKVKLTRGSRACIAYVWGPEPGTCHGVRPRRLPGVMALAWMALTMTSCRKIKMRCIPDESSGPNGPCKVCRAPGGPGSPVTY